MARFASIRKRAARAQIGAVRPHRAAIIFAAGVIAFVAVRLNIGVAICFVKMIDDLLRQPFKRGAGQRRDEGQGQVGREPRTSPNDADILCRPSDGH